MYDEDLGKPSLARWAPHEPDNGDGKDCVDIHLYPGLDVYMNDAGCGWRNHPYSAEKNPYFGLCEIPIYKCIP